MSYILDALTKSQRERRSGDVPTLDTPNGLAPSSQTFRIGFPILAFVVVAGLFAILGIYARMERSGELVDSDAATPATPVAVQDATPEPAPILAPPLALAPPSHDSEPVPMPAPELPASPSEAAQFSLPARRELQRTTTRQPSNAPHADEAPLPALVVPPQATPMPIAPAPVATAVRKPTVTAAARAAPTVRSRRPRTAPALKIETPRTRAIASTSDSPVTRETEKLVEELLALSERAPPKPLQPVPALPAPYPARGGVTSIPDQRSTAMARLTPPPEAAADAVPSINGLPSDLRQSIGNLTINAHVYTEVPGQRLVVINLQRYREGERLKEGPRIDAITPRGAVLSHESHRFRLDAR